MRAVAAASLILIAGFTAARCGRPIDLKQALTLTDIVVSATVTALLLALAIQVAKRHRTVDPDELNALRG